MTYDDQGYWTRTDRPEMLSDRLGYPPERGDEDWAARAGTNGTTDQNTDKGKTMSYHDDQAPPFADLRIPYDPWSGPHKTPASEDERRAIQALLDGHPNWSPPQIREHLLHSHGLTVSVAVICGVRAGL